MLGSHNAEYSATSTFKYTKDSTYLSNESIITVALYRGGITTTETVVVLIVICSLFRIDGMTDWLECFDIYGFANGATRCIILVA